MKAQPREKITLLQENGMHETRGPMGVTPALWGKGSLGLREPALAWSSPLTWSSWGGGRDAQKAPMKQGQPSEPLPTLNPLQPEVRAPDNSLGLSETQSGTKPQSPGLCLWKASSTQPTSGYWSRERHFPVSGPLLVKSPWDFVGDNWNLPEKIKIPSHCGVASTVETVTYRANCLSFSKNNTSVPSRETISILPESCSLLGHSVLVNGHQPALWKDSLCIGVCAYCKFYQHKR